MEINIYFVKMVTKFVCEYNGKNFCGFQRQKNLRTVQLVLEEALSKYFGERIKIVGSGRTDTGVHAKGQVCSFIKEVKDLYKLNTAINAFLPTDVSVRDFEAMPDDFHAQFSAKAKTYVYKCYVSKFRSALRDDTHLQLYTMPDINKAKAAAKKFVGTMDFKKYTTDKTDSKGFVRTIYSFDINTSGDEIHLVVKGSGFMRNMVRILCGAVLGLDKTLPAHALYLDNVEY